jgi:UTP--glucose-1-phosphate uridylyltransferase
VSGIWKDHDRLLSITEFKEKPSADYARKHLLVEGMAKNLLSVLGMYVLDPKVFDYLEENIRNNNREGGGFQLTSCLNRLRQQ